MLRSEGDADMAELAQAEIAECGPGLERLRAEIDDMFYPADPNDSKDVIVEIRAGTGGEEAALFAGELFRMYTRYAERKGWQVEVLSST
jgi:peptide chain release factor 1